MKLFSAIMAIYIMGLLLVPCADAHAENDSTNTNTELIDINKLHVDTCSPFCLCDCCQIVSQPEYHSFVTPSIITIEKLAAFYRAFGASVPITLWRPPKI